MSNKAKSQSDELLQEVEKLTLELVGARERERRAVADYQNLVRRSAEERVRVVKLAALDFVENLLEPLSHLSLASEQINDQGLKMVVGQLWQKLNEAGLEEIDPIGQVFDVQTMEAVPDPESKAKSEVTKEVRPNETASVREHKVTKVVAKGYRLGGEVIRHAKVIVD